MTWRGVDLSDVEKGDLSDVERGTSVTWRGVDLSDMERGDLSDMERGDLSEVEGGTTVMWRWGTCCMGNSLHSIPPLPRPAPWRLFKAQIHGHS